MGHCSEYSVFGDVVNTASRIEDLCKAYKTDIGVASNRASRGHIRDIPEYLTSLPCGTV